MKNLRNLTKEERKKYIDSINDEFIEKKHSNYFEKSKYFWGDRIGNLIVDSDHQNHNSILGYKDNILKFLQENKNKLKGKKALDYGAGGGRNISNMLDIVDFKLIHGIDISEYNIVGIINNLKNKGYNLDKIKTQITKGWNLGDESNLEKNYDFIMSVITFEHIPLYDVRINILKHFYNKLNKGGTLIFHMTNDPDHPKVNYYENSEEVSHGVYTINSSIDSFDQIIQDLELIGFDKTKIETNITPGDVRCTWFWVKCIK